ncbi:hypothetical protein ET464_06260 [Paenibacillus protaetiae]|uniref:Uncharacterized protein n=2 Tax=Paenibacillus protaetiae TaxID=2509456 RepID=A0A4P6ESW5_9BACL|nr:hypothetical protein ET464_06260 [Paenibacillus protaetiae]
MIWQAFETLYRLVQLLNYAITPCHQPCPNLLFFHIYKGMSEYKRRKCITDMAGCAVKHGKKKTQRKVVKTCTKPSRTLQFAILQTIQQAQAQLQAQLQAQQQLQNQFSAQLQEQLQFQTQVQSQIQSFELSHQQIQLQLFTLVQTHIQQQQQQLQQMQEQIDSQQQQQQQVVNVEPEPEPPQIAV